MSGEVKNPVIDEDAEDIPVVIEGSGGRSLCRQVQLLTRKQIFMKQRALKWTLLEIFFPLYPIMFLYLIFKFGSEFLPYEKIVTDAVDFQPAQPLVNNSLPGLVVMMGLGGKVGFAPVDAASTNAARVVQRAVCLATEMTWASMAPAMAGTDLAFVSATQPASGCKLYPTPDVMNENGGWMPLFEADGSTTASVNTGGKFASSPLLRVTPRSSLTSCL